MNHQDPAIDALQSVIAYATDVPPEEWAGGDMTQWYRQRLALIANCARNGIKAASEAARN